MSRDFCFGVDSGGQHAHFASKRLEGNYGKDLIEKAAAIGCYFWRFGTMPPLM